MKLYPSDLENFLRCSHRFYLTRIKEIKSKTNLNILAGRAFHRAVENDVSFFLRERKHLDLEVFQKTAEGALKIEMDIEMGNIELDKEEPLEKQYQEAYNMLMGFCNQYYNLLELNLFIPTGSEQNFELDIEGISLAGRFDLLTEKGLVEFKTKKERLPKNYDPDTSLQNNIYLMALKHIKNLKEALYIFISPKDFRYFKTNYKQNIEDKTIKILKSINKSIENQIFLPAPQDESNWVCDYCGVREHCEYILRK